MMLNFLSVRVSAELHAHWIRVKSTTDSILTANPAILNYWTHIRRDQIYLRLLSPRTNTDDDDDNNWKKQLLCAENISANDIDEIYRFIRTFIHVKIEAGDRLSPYYAQTKEKKIDKTMTITLSARLLQSNSDPFVFVAAAVLLRELTRTMWPDSLKDGNTAKFLEHPMFFSWTGLPEKLWPKKGVKRRPESRARRFYYVTRPSDGQESLVADAGNLFQHVFFGGDVHLYDDEVDDQNGEIIVQVAVRVDPSPLSLCAARYVDDKLLHEFFNEHQYCLDTILQLKDLPCPYYKYVPIERLGNYVHDIAVDDRSLEERPLMERSLFSRYLGRFYEYKPYRLREPRQHYQQTFIYGQPPKIYSSNCARFSEHVIRTDDAFFVANRHLFRRKEPIQWEPYVKDEYRGCWQRFRRSTNAFVCLRWIGRAQRYADGLSTKVNKRNTNEM